MHWNFQVHHYVYVFVYGKNFIFLQWLQKSSRAIVPLTLNKETFYKKKKKKVTTENILLWLCGSTLPDFVPDQKASSDRQAGDH